MRKNLNQNLKIILFTYDESEILKDEKKFFDQILSSSFFEKQKLILISRSTDKILKIAEEIIDRKIEDLKIIFISEKLEKNLKLDHFLKKKKTQFVYHFT